MLTKVNYIFVKNPSRDINQMYTNNELLNGDIVFHLYKDDYFHIFFNNKKCKAIYKSPLNIKNEIEDDVSILSSSIIDSLVYVSNNYLQKEQYLKDEELIASTFADLNNKINNFDISKLLEPIYSNISNLNSSVKNVSDVLHTLTETENINNTIDTFKEVEDFLNNISDSSTLTELLLNTKTDIIDEIDTKIDNINTSINNTSSRIKELEKLYTNNLIDTFISNLNTSIKNNSDNLKIVSDKTNEVSTNLLNYLTINQYLKDEELIASTFADLNNKINSLYTEIAELKELLNSSTK